VGGGGGGGGGEKQRVKHGPHTAHAIRSTWHRGGC